MKILILCNKIKLAAPHLWLKVNSSIPPSGFLPPLWPFQARHKGHMEDPSDPGGPKLLETWGVSYLCSQRVLLGSLFCSFVGWGDLSSILQRELGRPGYAHLISLLLPWRGGSLRGKSENFILNPTHEPFELTSKPKQKTQTFRVLAQALEKVGALKGKPIKEYSEGFERSASTPSHSNNSQIPVCLGVTPELPNEADYWAPPWDILGWAQESVF